MWLLADFAFVPMTRKKWDKVLNKWKFNSAEDLIGQDRYDILDEIQDVQKFRDISNLKPNVEFLKKYYVDPTKNKKRKLVTGVAVIPKKDSKKVVVSLLAGNPKGDIDPKFKGAINSLDKKVGKRKIDIIGMNQDVDNMYKKKFGDRLV